MRRQSEECATRVTASPLTGGSITTCRRSGGFGGSKSYLDFATDHSYRFRVFRYDGQVQNIRQLDDALGNILGLRPRFFRPPYGAYDDSTRSAARALGYDLVIWNIDTLDWSFRNPDASMGQIYNAMGGANPGTQGFIALGKNETPLISSFGLSSNRSFVSRTRHIPGNRLHPCTKSDRLHSKPWLQAGRHGNLLDGFVEWLLQVKTTFA